MAQSEVAKKIIGAVDAADKGIQQFFRAFTLVKDLREGFRRINGDEEEQKHE